VARGAADTLEGLGGREMVVAVVLATGVVKLTDESGSALKSILFFSGPRIAMGISAAGKLARFSSMGFKAGAITLAAGITFLCTDVSTEKAAVLRDSTLAGNLNDLVDLLTITDLIEQSTMISLTASFLEAELSKNVRNIVLRDIESILFKLQVTGLALSSTR